MQKHSTGKGVRYKLLDFITDHGYRVGDDGSVWSRKVMGTNCRLRNEWRKLRQFASDRYMRVGLYKNSRVTFHCVHKLVLNAFVGPCPEGMQCRHLDGDKENNRLDNLCWGTPKENAEDRKRHGTNSEGEKNGSSKLTWKKVDKIRELYGTGKHTYSTLAVLFGVSNGAIAFIIRRDNWK